MTTVQLPFSRVTFQGLSFVVVRPLEPPDGDGRRGVFRLQAQQPSPIWFQGPYERPNNTARRYTDSNVRTPTKAKFIVTRLGTTGAGPT